MIDIFALAVSHGLLLLAVYRAVQRDDLDRQGQADEEPPRA